MTLATGDEREGREAAARAKLALEAGGMASWRWDVATNMIVGDDQLAELYGFAPGHWPVPLGAMTANIHPADKPSVDAAIIEAIEGGAEYRLEFRVARRPGAPPDDAAAWRWLGGRGRVIERREDGVPSAVLGVNWDMTDEKQVRERLALTALEMDYRVKNTFAVLRALVNIGRRRATSLASFADDLAAQIQAMADGHEVTTRLAREGGDPNPAVPVAEIVRLVLGPWLTRAATDGRVRVSLNPALGIGATRVSSLAMLLRELETNAVKHGALGPDGGRLTVTVEETRRAGARAARLVWSERWEGTGRAPAEGGTSGLGSVLIDHCLSILGGQAERAMRPEGLKMTIVLPAA